MTGCKHGAKNTLDRNYLFLAEKLGCEVHPETLVTDVRPAAGRRVRGPRGPLHVVARAAAARLPRPRGGLRGGRARHDPPPAPLQGARAASRGLSDQLGNYVRTNSEALLGAVAPDERIDFSEGIAITSGVDADDHTHMEIVRHGKGQDFMSLLTTHLTPDAPPWPRWARWLGRARPPPAPDRAAPLPAELGGADDGPARHAAGGELDAAPPGPAARAGGAPQRGRARAAAAGVHAHRAPDRAAPRRSGRRHCPATSSSRCSGTAPPPRTSSGAR